MQAEVLHVLCAHARMRGRSQCAALRVLGFYVCMHHRGTEGTTGDLPRCLPESGVRGLHRGPDGPSTAELLAFTGQTSMADLLRWYRVRWLGHAARKPNE